MGNDYSTMVIESDKKIYLDASSSWAFERMKDARSWYPAYCEDDDYPSINLTNGNVIGVGSEFDGVKKAKTQQSDTERHGNYQTTTKWIEMKDVNFNLRIEEATPNTYVKFLCKDTWAESDTKKGDPYNLEFNIQALSNNSCEITVTMTFSNSSCIVIPCVIICGSCIRSTARGKMSSANIKMKTNLDKELHTSVKKMGRF